MPERLRRILVILLIPCLISDAAFGGIADHSHLLSPRGAVFSSCAIAAPLEGMATTKSFFLQGRIHLIRWLGRFAIPLGFTAVVARAADTAPILPIPEYAVISVERGQSLSQISGDFLTKLLGHVPTLPQAMSFMDRFIDAKNGLPIPEPYTIQKGQQLLVRFKDIVGADHPLSPEQIFRLTGIPPKELMQAHVFHPVLHYVPATFQSVYGFDPFYIAGVAFVAAVIGIVLIKRFWSHKADHLSISSFMIHDAATAISKQVAKPARTPKEMFIRRLWRDALLSIGGFTALMATIIISQWKLFGSAMRMWAQDTLWIITPAIGALVAIFGLSWLFRMKTPVALELVSPSQPDEPIRAVASAEVKATSLPTPLSASLLPVSPPRIKPRVEPRSSLRRPVLTFVAGAVVIGFGVLLLRNGARRQSSARLLARHA